jgi:hypothetical protein
MVDSIIYVLKFYKNMSISPSLLFSILAGEFNNRINTFQMYQNPKFGYITNNDKRKFYLLLDALKYSKIISIDENNYNAINLLKDNLSENNYKEIYASIKL